MSYDHEEFDYLCALFDASRDALRLHSGWEDIAEEFDELGAAVREHSDINPTRSAGGSWSCGAGRSCAPWPS